MTSIQQAGRVVVVFVVLASIATLVACKKSSPVSPDPSAGLVRIVGSDGPQAFSPASIVLTSGQKLLFRNDTGVTHRILADNGSFDAGNISSGVFSASSVTVPGAVPVPFHCSIHPSMVGTVTPTP